ncbi:HET-C-related protein [Pseudomonas cremoricolorata]|uniref:HET-C-related protein n=1 Tax=Pseudomonas cremoricolorata TaxID=157783 RepID=UPI000675D43B|nr:HET-C-related protein [Pseudomonas cremoricolorata]
MHDTPSFHSRFALEQLQRIAAQFSAKSFEALTVAVFGRRVSAEQYLKLHSDLLADALPNPGYRVLDDSDASGAVYDPADGTIQLPRSVIEQALQDSQASAPLLVSLIEAFGDYLRTGLHDSDIDQAAAVDALFEPSEPSTAGQRYAVFALVHDPVVQGELAFAEYTSSELTANLILTLPTNSAAPSEVDTVDAAPALLASRLFGAGEGNGTHSFGHGRIAKALGNVGFTREQIDAIYFGNWLRDYSQLVDPKIVRTQDAPKDFPSKLSREVLTEVVDLLALKEFHHLQQDDRGRAFYTVTPQVLGVYKPSEHIDNPLTLDADAKDPRSIDPDFEPLVLADSPQAQIDEQRAMRRHIDDAVDFMYNKMIEAMSEGPTPKGLREFGAGLHTLEDFFAHSNFVELSLRKVGHDKVLPWVCGVESQREHPVITGLFGGLDVLASVAEPMAKVLFPANGHIYKPIEPGARSDQEQMLLILLKEHPNPKLREDLVTALEFRDKLADNPLLKYSALAKWALTLPLALLGSAQDVVLKNLLTWAGDQIDDIQTLLQNDPNVKPGTYATHSQLAKDHDTHPFHELAALLAAYAVERVGWSMHAYWAGDHDRDPATVAKSFIGHPDVDDWQDEIVATWANAHPDAITAGESADELTRRKREISEQGRARLKEMDQKHSLNIIDVTEAGAGLIG